MARAIADGLSRTVIEGIHDCGHLLSGQAAKILLFPQKLTDQAIRVCFDSPYPRGIRMGKVNLGLKILRHSSMITEFAAIVIRDRVPTGHGLADGRSCLACNALEDRVLGSPFHHRHQDPLMAFANHRIPLPITNAFAGWHHRRPCINRHVIGDLSSSTIRAIAFPSLLLAAQRAVQITARPFILIDRLIDPLRTDGLTLFML